MSIEPHGDDDITEADIAAGFLTFCEGFAAGERYELRNLSDSLKAIFASAPNDNLKELLQGALNALELDHFVDGSAEAMIAGIECLDEDPFVEWRKTHPRDAGSPVWDGDRTVAPDALPSPDTILARSS